MNIIFISVFFVSFIYLFIFNYNWSQALSETFTSS